jgi:iron donor protein CyaY
MLDEVEFRSLSEIALEALKQHLFVLEEGADAGFEIEEQNGVLNVEFDEPPGKFVITPNAVMRQIWISALSTSFKLDWDVAAREFILPRTGEQLTPLVDRLIHDHLQSKEYLSLPRLSNTKGPAKCRTLCVATLIYWSE